MLYSDRTHIDDNQLFNGQFMMINTDILFSIGGKSSFKLVYLTLLSYRNSTNNDCYPSYESLVEKSQLSRATVWRALVYLKKNKFIEIHKRKNRDNHSINIYRFLNPLKIKTNEVKKPQQVYHKIGDEVLNTNDGIIDMKDDLIEKMMNELDVEGNNLGIKVSFDDYVQWYENQLKNKKIKQKNHFTSFKKWGLNGFINQKKSELHSLS